MAKKTVDREKRREWKTANMFFEGIASVIVFLTILVDMISILGSEKITQIASIISAILVLACCFFNYKWVMKHFNNKPLLDAIFNFWTGMGIFTFVVEKLVYTFIDYSKNWVSRVVAILLVLVFLIAGIIRTVIIVLKKEWTYMIEADEG